MISHFHKERFPDTMVKSMGHLVLVRHGESRWNQCNKFTGWIDVPLSENGIREAQACAKHCKRYEYTSAFTSKLERAHLTLSIILASQDRTGIVQHEHDAKYYRWMKRSNHCSAGDLPVFESAALNERYYGALQGMEKGEAERKYGAEKLLSWRRGFRGRPSGGGESLEDTFMRVQPYFTRYILPRVKKSEDILFVGHGNTMRAMIKHLEKISDEDIAFLDLPNAMPIIYEYRRGKFNRTEGEYTFRRPLR